MVTAPTNAHRECNVITFQNITMLIVQIIRIKMIRLAGIPKFVAQIKNNKNKIKQQLTVDALNPLVIDLHAIR